jgi:YggT family protein
MFGKPKSPRSPYDWPCFCVLVLVVLLKFIAIGTLFLGVKLPWSFIPLYTLADLIVEPCNLLFYALIIRVIMSWVNPKWHHPLVEILRITTDPLLRKARAIMPATTGFDFSPYLVLILLKIITLYISASLPLHLI